MYVYQVDTGVIVPDTSTILTEIQEEFKSALGASLVLDAETPQGVFMAALALMQEFVVNNNAQLANQINPNLAGGVFLDAICALMDLDRTTATYSTVMINVTGVPGTIIPETTSTIVNPNNETFAASETILINDSGVGSGQFKAVNSGPISIPVNSVRILTGVPGWETATNPEVASLGSTVQSDPQYRLERKNTLALQGSSLAEAIISGVRAIPTVTSVGFRENIKSTPETIDSIPMVPNSIYVCVSGGTNLEVATAILSKKSGGCDYNNGPSTDPVNHITQAVVEPASGQTYEVKFDRPELIPISIKVQVKQNSAIVNPVSVIKGAILAYANGDVGSDPGFAIGVSVSAYDIYKGIVAVEDELVILFYGQKLLSDTIYNFDTIEILPYQRATINEASIVVEVIA